MKRLLVLGGDHFTIPVVEAAHKQGYHVITCDYLPDNVAHRVSDEYVNFSTTDMEGILGWAQKHPIDGVVTFTDSGVVTTAYLQHNLGLPQIGPLDSVRILQNKALFRKFLTDNGFNVPRAMGFSNYDEAIKNVNCFRWPVIVKPVDSAGSKGVTRVDDIKYLEDAVKTALYYSVSKQFIIEEYIEKKGCSSDSDSFSINGQFRFVSFSAQRFDDKVVGIFTPAAYSWPSTMDRESEAELESELQRLITLLGMGTTIYNIESRIGIDGKLYIMEVTPRGGGNRLAEMIRFATGVDMVTAAVRAAVGDPVNDMEQKPYDGYWAEVILHAERTGVLEEVVIGESVKRFVRELDLWYKKGDEIREFQSARDAIGTLVLRFDREEEMDKTIESISSWLKVIVS